MNVNKRLPIAPEGSNGLHHRSRPRDVMSQKARPGPPKGAGLHGFAVPLWWELQAKTAS